MKSTFQFLHVCYVTFLLWLTPVAASTRVTLEQAQQMYQENPTTENWDQLMALESQAKFNDAYPYILAGCIIVYVALRMIFSNRIRKS